MKICALDLAEHCGYAIAQNLPEPVTVTCDLPGSAMHSEVRTWVQVLESGVLLLGKPTSHGEGAWLRRVHDCLIDFLKAHPVDVVVYEFSPWLRGSGKTSTRGMLTTTGLRTMVLLASTECGLSTLEVSPNEWQDKLIGRGRRDLQKAKAKQVAAMHLGQVVDSPDETDALLIADYILASLRAGEKASERDEGG
jgi:Holliday junction resolvasome RuvABC endonuclease subunit